MKKLKRLCILATLAMLLLFTTAIAFAATDENTASETVDQTIVTEEKEVRKPTVKQKNVVKPVVPTNAVKQRSATEKVNETKTNVNFQDKTVLNNNEDFETKSMNVSSQQKVYDTPVSKQSSIKETVNQRKSLSVDSKEVPNTYNDKKTSSNDTAAKPVLDNSGETTNTPEYTILGYSYIDENTIRYTMMDLEGNLTFTDKVISQEENIEMLPYITT